MRYRENEERSREYRAGRYAPRRTSSSASPEKRIRRSVPDYEYTGKERGRREGAGADHRYNTGRHDYDGYRRRGKAEPEYDYENDYEYPDEGYGEDDYYDDYDYDESEYDDEYADYDDGHGGRRSRAGKPSGSDMKKGSSRKRKRPVIKIIATVLLLFAAFFAGKSLLQGNNWTVAVFGVDARDGELEEGTRSDVIMVVNVNKSSGEVKLVSVFRDTYLKIDDEGNYHKINTAYERGGHEQAVKALEENLDIKIDDYITFSWSAVAKGINALGGIDLEISDAEFSYINAFITETVNSTGIGSVQLQHAGANHLDGVQAVAYGRLRLMDTDFNRTARQRKVIGLAVEKAKAADLNTLKSAALAVLPEVSTSVGIDDLLPLLKNISKYQIGESTGFPFSRQTMDIGKLDCVVPTTLESNVAELHRILFGEENYTPSSAVKKISAHISEVTGLTEAGEKAPEAGTGGGIVKKDNTPAEKETAAPDISSEESPEDETQEGNSESEPQPEGEDGEEPEASDEDERDGKNENNSDEDKDSANDEDGLDKNESKPAKNDKGDGETEKDSGKNEPAGGNSGKETAGAENGSSPIVSDKPAENPGKKGPGEESSGSQNNGGTGVVVPGGPGSLGNDSGSGVSEGPAGGPGVQP